MAETIEQVTAHRDQLKAENDRLNPLCDQQKQQIETLQLALKTAQVRGDDLAGKLATEQVSHQQDVESAKLALGSAGESAAKLNEKLIGETTAHQATAAERDKFKAQHNAILSAATSAAKSLNDEILKIG